MEIIETRIRSALQTFSLSVRACVCLVMKGRRKPFQIRRTLLPLLLARHV